MEVLIPLWIVCGASILVVLLPGRFSLKYFTGLTLLTGLVGWLASLAIPVLATGEAVGGEIGLKLITGTVTWQVDPLSAFFLLVVGFTLFTGYLFARGYLKPYQSSKSPFQMGLHLFSYLWLGISMILVIIIREAVGFLVVWEIMALTSFLLVIFESEKPYVLKTGIQYLVQMHVGFLFLLAAFLISGIETGISGFDGLSNYFSHHSNWPLFLIFFIGFGIKAGFIPLHTWLPHAHPAAPSHVSGVMSGVMIKMGIYGILRVLTQVQADYQTIGLIILAVSMVTGIGGILLSIMQHDLKKLLAYSSIENIGIIGIGIGLGVIGIGRGLPALTFLGFGGGLLHVLNHSLFKSLLFFSGGAVYSRTHSRDLNQLGGILKRMPWTGVLFLIGVMAICGLPPFNGFISEFLIYSGALGSLQSSGLNMDLLLLGAILGLTLIGGLAIFGFTRVFGMVFLGTPRTEKAIQAKEVKWDTLLSMGLIAIVIGAIGLFPGWVTQILGQVIDAYVSGPRPHPGSVSDFEFLHSISWVGGALILIVVTLVGIRFWVQRKAETRLGPTWGCGYSAADPVTHQYTATSYADNLRKVFKPFVKVKRELPVYGEEEIFAEAREFHTYSEDPVEVGLLQNIFHRILDFIKDRAVIHSGVIQHYVLYGLVFIVLIFFLTLFNII